MIPSLESKMLREYIAENGKHKKMMFLQNKN